MAKKDLNTVNNSEVEELKKLVEQYKATKVADDKTIVELIDEKEELERRLADVGPEIDEANDKILALEEDLRKAREQGKAREDTDQETIMDLKKQIAELNDEIEDLQNASVEGFNWLKFIDDERETFKTTIATAFANFVTGSDERFESEKKRIADEKSDAQDYADIQNGRDAMDRVLSRRKK